MESLENREMMSANSIQSIDEQPVYEPTAMIAPPVIQASAQNENVPFIAAALPTVDYDFGTVTTAKTRTDTYNREHWYKFTVSDWTTVTLEGLTQDHRLEIYAADGTTRLTYNMNSGTHYKSVSLGTTGETRTFYARVYYDSDTVNNSDTYTLRIEPTVNLGTVTATKNQTDTYKGGDRWYKFTVSDITTVTLEGLMQDHRLEIYAADGTTRLTYNMNSGTHYKSASLGTTGETRTFYARVYYDSDYVNNNDTFTLRIEPTVNLGTVTAVLPRTDTYKGGERWYKFTVSSGATVTLEGLAQDHRLEIYASNGTTRVGYNMNSGTSNKSVSLGTAGTYYAVVYYDSDYVNNNDTYTLRITPTVPAAPVVTVTNQAGSVKLTWGTISGADRYEILRQNSNGSWTTLGYTTALQYVDSSVTVNVATSYIVRACKGSAVSAFTIVYGRAQLGVPQVAVTNQLGSVKLTWGTISGADRYEILRQNSNGSWTTLGYTTALQYVDSSVAVNVATSYIVRACKGSAVSAFTIVYGRAQLGVPQVAVTNQPGSVKLTWGTISGADRYEILRQNSNGSWTTLGYTTALQYVDSSVTVNVATSYIVRACKGSAVSTFTIVYGRAQLGVPQVAVTNQSGSVKLTWGTISGVDRYEILRQNSNGSWTTLGYTTALQYVDSSVAVNVATSYIVRACKGSAVSAFTIVYGKALPKNTSAASFFALSEAEIDELFLQPIV